MRSSPVLLLAILVACAGCTAGGGDVPGPVAAATARAAGSVVAATPVSRSTKGAPANAGDLAGDWVVLEVLGEAGPGVAWFNRMEVAASAISWIAGDGNRRSERYHLGSGVDGSGQPVVLLCRDGQLPWVVQRHGDDLWLIEDVVGGYRYHLARTQRG